MPKSPNQKLKLLYLQKILLECTDDLHSLSLAQIAAALAEYGILAERKSLYADLEALRTFGLDVEKRGSAGRCGYAVVNRSFELPELKLLVDAVQSSRFITHKKSNELIHKVESLASIYEGKLLQRQVYVTNRIKAMNESIYYNIDSIHAAISTDRKISFLYFEWAVDFSKPQRVKKQFRKNGGRYCISPWALVWDDENYYMVGFDSEAGISKHYRVDKMSSIELTEEAREGQEQFSSFDPAVYTKKVFDMFGGREETVTLRFANRLIGAVLDRFGKDVFLSPAGDSHFDVTVRAVVSPRFLSWVFGFQTDARVISPPSVVQAYRQMALDALKEAESNRQ